MNITEKYMPLRNTVLIAVKKETEGGILLPDSVTGQSNSQEVVAVGPETKYIKVGDQVIGTGAGMLIKIENPDTGKEEDFIQVTEYSIIGIIKNGAKVQAYGEPNVV